MRNSLIQMNGRSVRARSSRELLATKRNSWSCPSLSTASTFRKYRDYKYMDYAEADDGDTQSRMKQAARDHGIWLVSTIFETERPVYNFETAMLINLEGQIAGKYRKVHPAALRSLEKIYFRDGSSFPVFRLGEWTVGISTCYDNLFLESWRCLALCGAERIVAPYATPSMIPGRTF